ncbi:regulator of G-protein signaling 2 [Osmerus eperlanus]|uniref:regulator of G-protein signaling 2 n=1 Tax=Osmerus eperlanus TaxID=29151 RepID=UPI002E1613E7
MKKNMGSESNKVCIDCLKTEQSIENSGMSKKSWRARLRYILKNRSFSSRSTARKKQSFRPTVDEVNQWAQSFDKLLTHKYGNVAFQIFLKSEYCEENLEFWMACEEFRKVTSPAKLALRAQSIYEEFIKTEAPKEINLDFHTKEEITHALPLPTLTCFLAAQKRVYSLMENNSYPRFINSELYKELCAAARRRRPADSCFS